jgi:hypothetical protein
MTTKQGYNSRRTYRVRCRSGITGWRTRLRNNYENFKEWRSYSETWGLAERLGYRSDAAAWQANPIIEGSNHDGDFRRVR